MDRLRLEEALRSAEEDRKKRERAAQAAEEKRQQEAAARQAAEQQRQREADARLARLQQERDQLAAQVQAKSGSSTPVPLQARPVACRYVSMARITNHTRHPILVEIEFADGWRFKLVEPGMGWNVGLPEKPVRMRWNDHGRLRETILPAYRIEPPFPSDFGTVPTMESIFRSGRYSPIELLTGVR